MKRLIEQGGDVDQQLTYGKIMSVAANSKQQSTTATTKTTKIDMK